jgi:hypothetical protein
MVKPFPLSFGASSRGRSVRVLILDSRPRAQCRLRFLHCPQIGCTSSPIHSVFSQRRHIQVDWDNLQFDSHFTWRARHVALHAERRLAEKNLCRIPVRLSRTYHPSFERSLPSAIVSNGSSTRTLFETRSGCSRSATEDFMYGGARSCGAKSIETNIPSVQRRDVVDRVRVVLVNYLLHRVFCRPPQSGS